MDSVCANFIDASDEYCYMHNRIRRYAAQSFQRCQCPLCLIGLALCYRRGYGGVKRNFEHGVKLMEKAVEGGAKGLLAAAAERHDNARFYYALAHEEGFIVDKDIRRALRLFKELAEAGHCSGASMLGWLLSEGVDDSSILSINRTEAIRWYRIASDKGHAAAAFNLAIMLREDGSDEEAVRYYTEAAATGHTGSMTNLAVACQLSHYVHDDRTSFYCYKCCIWYLRAVNIDNDDAIECRRRFLQRPKEMQLECCIEEATAISIVNTYRLCLLLFTSLRTARVLGDFFLFSPLLDALLDEEETKSMLPDSIDYRYKYSQLVGVKERLRLLTVACVCEQQRRQRTRDFFHFGAAYSLSTYLLSLSYSLKSDLYAFGSNRNNNGE